MATFLVLFVISTCAWLAITRLLDGDRRAIRAEVRRQRALEGKLGVMEQAFALATEPVSNMLEEQIRESLATPDHQIQAWTPQEREAFGINDTIKLIDRIDRELRVVEQAETAKAAREGRLQATTPTPRIPDADYDVVEVHAFGVPTPIRTHRVAR